MTMLDKVIEQYPEESFLKADGYDDAVIGVDEKSMRLIYSNRKYIEILMQRDGMDEEEAIDYFYYNTVNAFVGKKTPIWCEDVYL